ncbi:BamA/TamA family outer membrane protein [Danxiaibacter flavus]|uniref:BamA/TamA family outer membrane protein n=1 Tax=Danxiaibacter flavus TaxID=3049108 RepID=A0ABV3ZB16_9BACT|nr:BamA/TamA family outer membrane protein [Chitinophagaceae bacterium DXS]
MHQNTTSIIPDAGIGYFILKYVMKPLLLVAACLPAYIASAQNTSPITDTITIKPRDTSGIKDLSDYVKFLKKPGGGGANAAIVPHKMYTNILPFMGYNPAQGFMLGIAVAQAISLGNPDKVHLSTINYGANLTTNKQIILQAKSNLFLKEDSWLVKTDWRLMVFNQNTYGLGTGDPYSNGNGAETDINGVKNDAITYAQNMKYKYMRLYNSILKKVAYKTYVGVSLNLDYHFAIDDSRANADSGGHPTNYAAYNTRNGITSTSSSVLTGIGITAIKEGRDNTIRPTKGYYTNLAFNFYPSFLTSSGSATQLFFDARKYISLSHKTPTNILAFWYWTSLLLNGKLPYLATPSITWDTYNRSGRGYVQGRFRGPNMMYLEMEHRFPINRNGLLSGVWFINATTASKDDKSIKLFQYIDPGYGFGVRILLDKKTGTNITADYAWGLNKSKGLYLNLVETF